MTPEQLAAMGEPPSSVAYLTARQAVNIDGWELWDCDFCGQKSVSWCNACGRCKKLRGEGKASSGGAG